MPPYILRNTRLTRFLCWLLTPAWHLYRHHVARAAKPPESHD